MPPPMHTRSDEKSIESNPGACSNALNSVFTPVMNPNRVLRSSATKPLISRGSVISKLWPPSSMKHNRFAVNE